MDDTTRGQPPCSGKGQGNEEKGWMILPGDGLHVVEKDKVRARRRRGGYYPGMASM